MILFGNPVCEYCKDIKKLLEEKKIEFREEVVKIKDNRWCFKRDGVWNKFPENWGIPILQCGKMTLLGYKEIKDFLNG